MVFNFLWQHKPDKVKRETVFRNMKDGGLNMLNIRASILALKLTWIRRLANGEGIWQNILLHRFKLDLMLNCGYESKLLSQKYKKYVLERCILCLVRNGKEGRTFG